MPFYEYECEKCGHNFEAEQKITDEPLTNCPNCKTGTVKRLISHTSFALKGDGWYATDYTSKKKTDLPPSPPACEKNCNADCALNKNKSSDKTASA